jgi:hypothetical protein
MAEPKRSYTQAEVEAILRRAIARHASRGDSVAYEELLETAREVGVPPEDVEAAAREVAEETALANQQEALIARRWRGFWSHFTSYLVVNIGLWLARPGGEWHVLLAALWGIGLVSHLLATVMPGQERLAREAQRWREQQARRQEREDRRRRNAELHASAHKVAVGVVDAVAKAFDSDHKRR